MLAARRTGRRREWRSAGHYSATDDAGALRIAPVRGAGGWVDGWVDGVSVVVKGVGLMVVVMVAVRVASLSESSAASLRLR